MSQKKAQRVSYVCSTCGSTHVKADAYAVWNTKTQQWEVETTFDKGAYCEACDGETGLKEVKLLS
jgi:ribosomal protein L37AE/L43A